MNATDVAALIAASASRFGERDPQQFKQLSSRLSKTAEAEVALGLLQVFTHGAAPPEGSPSQELAGRLLAALRPTAEVNLEAVLRASLPRYELSVEQFPLYLRSIFGAESVKAVLQQLEREALSKEERRALETMRFWLSSSANALAQNGASQETPPK